MSIGSSETLYRMVNPKMWVTEENRISSALFKDKKGVSVDRDIERSQDEVIREFEGRGKELKGVVAIGVKECHSIPVLVSEDPIPENTYHALIVDSVEKIQLSKSKLKKIAEMCRLVKEY